MPEARSISRDTYYRYRRRYLEQGLEGLEDLSRRPIRSPAQIDPDVEVEICRMRGDHPRWGARRIRAELTRAGVDPPAVSTVHQALRRNHLVADQPPRRPKALKRFEREVSNTASSIFRMKSTPGPILSTSMKIRSAPNRVPSRSYSRPACPAVSSRR